MLKKYVFLATTLFSLSLTTLCPVVILVHGTIPPHKQILPQLGQWWKPGGDFFNVFEAAARQRGHMVVPYVWKGTPTNSEIEQAGIVLARLIASYPVSEHVILVGHSNGGRVIEKALQELYKPFKKIATTIAPVSIEAFIEQSFVNYQAERQYTVDCLINQLQPPKINGLDFVLSSRASIIFDTPKQDVGPMDHGQRRYLVDAVYCLGTPIDEKSFFIPTDLVGQIFNVYSNGDSIQQVLGFYKRQIPLQAKVANIELFVRNKGKNDIIKPGHSEMHGPLVGQWLFQLPELLSVAKANWHKQGADAKLVLDWERSPICLL